MLLILFYYIYILAIYVFIVYICVVYIDVFSHFCQMCLHYVSFFFFPHSVFLNYFFKLLFIYLFLAASGLRCCARAFSSFGEQGLLFFAVRGLLTAVASFAEEHGL